jgi:ABC-type branched-subunit amino acid transport system substrate-binding protein
MKKSAHWSWVLAVLPTTTVACGSGAAAPTAEINVAMVLDRTGANGSYVAIPDVIQMAFDDVNAGIKKAGGFKNVGFAHVDSDAAGSPATAAQMATQLVQGGAKFVITDNSSDTVAVVKIDYDADPTNDLNAPILCILCGSTLINNPAATDPDPVTQAALQNGKKWNFRLLMASNYLGALTAAQAMTITNGGDLNGDGVVKFSLYGSNEPQGLSSVNGFASAILAQVPNAQIEKIFHDPAADLNGPLWAADAIRLTDTLNETTGAVDGVPDLIFESSLPGTAIAFTRVYIQGRYTIPLLHGSPFGNETALVTLGSLGNGQEGLGHATYYPGASGDFFVQRYTAHFGTPPQSHERDGDTTYDSVMMGALATMIAVKDMADPLQVTGAQIQAALWTINDPNGTVITAGPDQIAKAIPLIQAGMPINYQGVSGPLDWDSNAKVLGAAAHWKIENGRFVDHDVYDCTTNPPCPRIPGP